MNTVRCHFFAMMLAAPTAVMAQTIPDDVSSIAPSVAAIAGSAERRVVLVERGFDPISHDVYLQWLGEPAEPGESRTILTTVCVAEFSSGMWRVFDPRFVDSRTLTLAAYFRFLDRPHEITITFTDPGHYTLRGELTVRADER